MSFWSYSFGGLKKSPVSNFASFRSSRTHGLIRTLASIGRAHCTVEKKRRKAQRKFTKTEEDNLVVSFSRPVDHAGERVQELRGARRRDKGQPGTENKAASGQDADAAAASSLEHAAGAPRELFFFFCEGNSCHLLRASAATSTPARHRHGAQTHSMGKVWMGLPSISYTPPPSFTGELSIFVLIPNTFNSASNARQPSESQARDMAYKAPGP